MSLESKCGPSSALELSADAAVTQATARIAAYERMVRVTAAGLGELPHAPAFHLSDQQLAGLFAPRALEVLILKPLAQAEPNCSIESKPTPG
jgi:hypothetical protein